MILVGEGHGDVGSLLCQLMAYQIAYKSLKINTVLEEMDHKMLNTYKQFGHTPTRQNKWTTVVEFLNTISESNPIIIPIDTKQSTYGGSAVNDPNDVKERNNTMAEESHKVKKDVLCIVGEAHLEGLLNDTNLIENFHVLPIATIDNKRRNTQKEIKDFTEVKKYEMFFSPKIIKHMYSKFPGWIEGLKANKHS